MKEITKIQKGQFTTLLDMEKNYWAALVEGIVDTIICSFDNVDSFQIISKTAINGNPNDVLAVVAVQCKQQNHSFNETELNLRIGLNMVVYNRTKISAKASKYLTWFLTKYFGKKYVQDAITYEQHCKVN